MRSTFPARTCFSFTRSARFTAVSAVATPGARAIETQAKQAYLIDVATGNSSQLNGYVRSPRETLERAIDGIGLYHQQCPGRLGAARAS